jgi:SAM-dependent methyltransferase
MSESNQLKITHDHWAQSAKKGTDERNVRPVAPDYQIQTFLENRITERLKKDWNCLDLGCGDGQSTLKFAQKVNSILGVDYISDYVQRAAKTTNESGISNAVFRSGDALAMDEFGLGLFDAVITIRCLINLGSWANQVKVIESVSRHVRSGGYYFCCEGWLDGVLRLSEARQRCGLSEFKTAKFNVFIDRKIFESNVSAYFHIEEYCSLGFYTFMSRLFQPFLVFPEQPAHDHMLNQAAGRLVERLSELGSRFDDFDYAGMYVLRRR